MLGGGLPKVGLLTCRILCMYISHIFSISIDDNCNFVGMFLGYLVVHYLLSFRLTAAPIELKLIIVTNPQPFNGFS